MEAQNQNAQFIDNNIVHLTKIKEKIVGLICLIEQNPNHLNMEEIMTTFSFISSKLELSSRTINVEMVNKLKNVIISPCFLSRDYDQHLSKITEGRFPMMSHDKVPQLLKTKLQPSIEQHLNKLMEPNQRDNKAFIEALKILQSNISKAKKTTEILTDHTENPDLVKLTSAAVYGTGFNYTGVAKPKRPISGYSTPTKNHITN
ncbi:Mediator complex subunit 8 [Intoshia linei]|uniref:Mediator of RNA polymerase II transcription subunit 8 n=1 Tax=Intoshia linei TaxID=1819745 RepID=A0A177B7Y9_9BILA|nr:Mediator complex subunit 8 [Intoshia linei]